jgi:hypothetical protein
MAWLLAVLQLRCPAILEEVHEGVGQWVSGCQRARCKDIVSNQSRPNREGTYTSRAPLVETEPVQRDMSAISIYEARSVLRAQPRCLQLIDLLAGHTLCCAVHIDLWDLWMYCIS